MRIVSVNVSLPRYIDWNGQQVLTGIYKTPIAGRVLARHLNLEGDQQADLTVHGGSEMAVYGYPVEHYEYWREILGEEQLLPGAFGENLTLEGMTETDVHVGDRFRMGSAEMMVTKPRVPCYKLAAKFGRIEIVREFLESGYSGFYFSVIREGEVGQDDTVTLIERRPGSISIAEVNTLRFSK